MPRGSRFARGREPRRDADGHSLPDDNSMRYCEVRLVCGDPLHEGRGPILGAWWIESTLPAFESRQVNERANHVVEHQLVDGEEGPRERLRFKMRCPVTGCRNSPVFKASKVDEALAAIFVHNIEAKVITIPV